jgi:hypothetical protein
MFIISLRNSYLEHTLRDSFTVTMPTGHPNSHNINLVKLCLHIPWSGIQMEPKRYKCVLLLPHRRSWGSRWWMCTCTANSRHNPHTIQRYIPIIVQRNDSTSSDDGVMGGSLDWFLLSIYSELHLDVGNEYGEPFARGIEVGGRGALVAR